MASLRTLLLQWLQLLAQGRPQPRLNLRTREPSSSPEVKAAVHSSDCALSCSQSGKPCSWADHPRELSQRDQGQDQRSSSY